MPLSTQKMGKECQKMEAVEQCGIQKTPSVSLNISLTNRQRTVRNAIIKSTGVRRKKHSGVFCVGDGEKRGKREK